MSTEWRQRIKVRKEEGKKGKKEVSGREGRKEGGERKKEKGRKGERKKSSTKITELRTQEC